MVRSAQRVRAKRGPMMNSDALLRMRIFYDPAFNALSISALSTVSKFSVVTGPTIL
jgi:hypothetical protein